MKLKGDQRKKKMQMKETKNIKVKIWDIKESEEGDDRSIESTNGVRCTLCVNF